MNLTQQNKIVLAQLIAFLIPVCAVGGYSMYRMAAYDDWSFWLEVAIPLCVVIVIPCLIYLKISERRSRNQQSITVHK